jgi:hypothetical protein
MFNERSVREESPRAATRQHRFLQAISAMPIVQSYCAEEAVLKGNTFGKYQAAVASNPRNLRSGPCPDFLPLTLYIHLLYLE